MLGKNRCQWVIQDRNIDASLGSTFTVTLAKPLNISWNNAGYIGMQGATTCPVGYHVPTKNEWKNLFDTIR